tara:strand:+ start:62 stop:892 length:831 start_codon:yes stop_codon:yes gene_type:complete
MLVEKIFPKDSQRYIDIQKNFQEAGIFIEKFSIMRLFIIWSMTVCGSVLSAGLEDRFVYWDWSGSITGLIRLTIVSAVFFLILRPNQLWTLGSKRLGLNELGSHTLMASALIFFGGIGGGVDLGRFILHVFPYVIGFMAAALVFQFPLKLDESKGEWFVESWENKFYYLGASSLFFLVAILAGFYLDDPILSTVAMVNLPFSMVALIFPNHVRHLQRARFYPLFIFSLFLSVRAPWFLIPLIILFYFFRTVNYFRYGIAYPSFAVDFDETTLYKDV